MKPATTPAAEPASILLNNEPRTVFLVQANHYMDRFEIYFAAGPTGRHGNIRAEVFLTPDQAERIARTILADLDGWAERVAKVQAAMGGAP